MRMLRVTRELKENRFQDRTRCSKMSGTNSIGVEGQELGHVSWKGDQVSHLYRRIYSLKGTENECRDYVV